MAQVKEKSIRDMDFEEISIKYENLFSKIIWNKLFKKINIEYRNKYQIFIRFKNEWYTSPSAMWRDQIAYGRNIIYWWFVEDLIIEVFKKNPLIKSVHLFWKDKNHDFIYYHEIKKIKIDWSKSTDPDIEIVLKNWNIFLVELKTANKNIFTIKRWNVESLFRSVANYEHFCLIMMLDLAKWLYEIRDLTYFESQKPFSNANMEWQICYNFPTPSTWIEVLTKINFDSFSNLLVLENIWVKKFQLLKIAIEKNDKTRKKIIENKIKLDQLEQEMNVKIDDFKDEINKIKIKTPQVKLSWQDIENKLSKI